MKHFDLDKYGIRFVAEKFNVSEVIGNNIPRCQELMDLLIENELFYDEENDRVESETEEVFAIVKLKDLDTVQIDVNTLGY